ncbi:hypothetical protein [Streptomyces sp. NBC_01615]
MGPQRTGAKIVRTSGAVRAQLVLVGRLTWSRTHDGHRVVEPAV